MRSKVISHDSPSAQWEMAFTTPPPALRPYVRQYVGWVEQRATPVRRRELPSGDVPLIINFGPAVRERQGGEGAVWHERRTFVAGLHDSFTVVEADEPGNGIQVNFTALGATLFLNRPLAELHNRSADLSDVLGAAADRLASELFDAASWDRRFDILDREILARLTAARMPSKGVAWTLEQLVRTDGRTPISALVRQTSWSERHFIAQFRAQFGVSPKSFARIIRFHNAIRKIQGGRGGSLTDIAVDCGYYDQSHFIRDFRAFAGVTPTELQASRLPDSGFRVD